MSLRKCFKYISDNKEVYLFIAPAFIAFSIFIVYPILSSWRFSLYGWSGMSQLTGSNFVGLNNFSEIIRDPYFWGAFKNNILYTFSVVPLLLIVSFILAIILNSKLSGKVIYRTIFYLPAVTSLAIIGVLMTFIFSPKGGAINEFLRMLHLIETPIDWLGDANYAMKAIIIVSIWHSAGIYMVYWLAGLQTIPKELYEAAEVDGAKFFDRMRYITLPLLRNIGAIITLLATVGTLRVFDLIMTMTGGGPFFSTEVVTLFVYRYAFGSSMGIPRIGYASAAAVIFGTTILAISIILTYIRNKIS